MRHITYLFIAIVSGCTLLFAAGCGSEQSGPGESEVTIPFDREGTLTFHRSSGLPPVTIDIEIAATDSARERGLMQRTSLPDRSGMLFIFDREAPRSFWMANTPLSLDIMFVSSDSTIINIAEYTEPGSPESVRSEAPAQYVVEVKAGFADRFGIVAGDRITWERTETLHQATALKMLER